MSIFGRSRGGDGGETPRVAKVAGHGSRKEYVVEWGGKTSVPVSGLTVDAIMAAGPAHIPEATTGGWELEGWEEWEG